MKTGLSLFLLLLTTVSDGQNFYIAHRGASHDAPENTVSAVRLAWELGADAVEIDIHLAADNRVMVIHDKDTHRTCTGKNMTVRSTPSVVLRELDAGIWKSPEFKGERIPFLEEVLATVPEGKTLVVEVKCGREVIPHLERVLAKCTRKPKVVFISFGWETIVELKKAFPENEAYFLSGSKQTAVKRLNEAAEAGLSGIDVDYGAIDEELVTLAKERNLEVIAYTVDNSEEARRLSALGITHFTTNRPDWLKKQLEQ
ncbi:MAG: glycerophosphodiester phosphodiesterase family protein [Prolixibacteraceae bacterium]